MISNIVSLIQLGVRHAKLVLFFAVGIATVGGAFAVGAAVRKHRAELASARAEARAAGLRADSATAVADTTRTIAGVYADSLALVTRRAVQLVQDRDAADRALAQERKAKADLSVQVVRLEAMAETLAQSVGDTLRGEFSLREPPYTVEAQVVMVPAPGVSRLTADVSLDSLPLQVRLGCDSAPVGGIRAAHVSVSGPTWARVGLSNVTQAPEVCNPTPAVGQAHGGGSGKGWGLAGLVIGGVAGFLLAN